MGILLVWWYIQPVIQPFELPTMFTHALRAVRGCDTYCGRKATPRCLGVEQVYLPIQIFVEYSEASSFPVRSLILVSIDALQLMLAGAWFQLEK